MKLLESSKSKITKDGHGENVSYSEITEAVLVHCNIVNEVQFTDQNSKPLETEDKINTIY